jgi:hypothetical protein
VGCSARGQQLRVAGARLANGLVAKVACAHARAQRRVDAGVLAAGRARPSGATAVVVVREGIDALARREHGRSRGGRTERGASQAQPVRARQAGPHECELEGREVAGVRARRACEPRALPVDQHRPVVLIEQDVVEVEVAVGNAGNTQAAQDQAELFDEGPPVRARCGG